ncbi:MAG TPA: sugar ABC transporter permease [Pilimelia sp.]|nr:sugar ABC transporter permease [Pilimelia sp.]
MRRGRYPFIAGFLVLPLALYGFFVLSPYVQTVVYSFTDWSGFSPEFNFVGMANYADLLKDEVFLRAVGHNAVILTIYPLVTILLALFFAFMLNVGGRGNRAGIRGVAGSGLYKIIFFFPQVMSIAIVAILWGKVFQSNEGGLLNALGIKLGLVDPADPPLWLGESDSVPVGPFKLGPLILEAPVVLWCLIAIAVWVGVGFYLVLFSAGMQSIPKDIFEAALLDGSSRVQTFFRVTLPLLWEHLSVAWVYLGIAALDFYLLVIALTQGVGGGGPDNASHVMSSWMLYTSFQSSRIDKFGYGCAMAIAIAMFTLIFAIIQLRITRRDKIEL